MIQPLWEGNVCFWIWAVVCVRNWSFDHMYKGQCSIPLAEKTFGLNKLLGPVDWDSKESVSCFSTALNNDCETGLFWLSGIAYLLFPAHFPFAFLTRFSSTLITKTWNALLWKSLTFQNAGCPLLLQISNGFPDTSVTQKQINSCHFHQIFLFSSMDSWKHRESVNKMGWFACSSYPYIPTEVRAFKQSGMVISF